MDNGYHFIFLILFLCCSLDSVRLVLAGIKIDLGVFFESCGGSH